MFPFQKVAETVANRKKLVARIRTEAARTLLHARASSAEHPVGGPSGYVRPVGPADYISPRLHSEIAELAHVCAKAFAVGGAAPQMGVNKRFLVINSGFFGPASPLTNLPYAHLTTPMNNALTPVSELMDRYPAPSEYPVPPRAVLAASRARTAATAAVAAAADSAAADAAAASAAKVAADAAAAAAAPDADAAAAAAATTAAATAASAAVAAASATSAAASAASAAAAAPSPSFKDYYPAYGLSPKEREEARYSHLLTDTLMNEYTVLLNPRISAVNAEQILDNEGCLSVPLWVRASPRSVAVDVEYDTFAFTPDVPPHEALAAEAATIEELLHASYPAAASSTAAAGLAAFKAEAAAALAQPAGPSVPAARSPLEVMTVHALPMTSTPAAVKSAAGGATFDAPLPTPFAPAPAIPPTPAFPPHSSSLGVDARRLASPYRPPMDPRWMQTELPELVDAATVLAATASASKAGKSAAKPAAAGVAGAVDDVDASDVPMHSQRRPLHARLRLSHPTLAPELQWYTGGAAAAGLPRPDLHALQSHWVSLTGLVPWPQGASLTPQQLANPRAPFAPEVSLTVPASELTSSSSSSSSSPSPGLVTAATTPSPATATLPMRTAKPIPSPADAAVNTAAPRVSTAGPSDKLAIKFAGAGAMGSKGKGKRAGAASWQERRLQKGSLSAIINNFEEQISGVSQSTASAVNRGRFERYMARQLTEQQQLLEQEKKEQEDAAKTPEQRRQEQEQAAAAEAAAADSARAASAPARALSPYAMGVRSAIAMVVGEEEAAAMPHLGTEYIPSPPLPFGFRVVRRRVTFRDLAARLVLHEIEHLDGQLFIDAPRTAVAAAADSAAEKAAEDADSAMIADLTYFGNLPEPGQAARGPEEMRLSYPINVQDKYVPAATVGALRRMREEIISDLFHRGVRLGPGHGGDETDEVGAELPGELGKDVRRAQVAEEAQARRMNGQ
jgi:peptide deformylase